MRNTGKAHTNRPPRFTPRLVFWETTTACNLKCVHCRACPVDQRSPEDLTTQQGKALLDEIASVASPAIVLSGGEPLVRPDVLEIAGHGTSKGLRMLLATNGTLVTPDVAREIAQVGIQRVSVSIDGATDQSHDAFRRIEGAFQRAWDGIANLKSAGIPFQVNTTVSKHNIEEIPQILDLTVKGGAVALHIFLLVPTGCGKEIADDEMIDPSEYERVLNWFYDRSKDVQISLKATCAPHYYRIMRQRAKEDGTPPPSGHGHDAVTKGCLAGSAVCFISHKGEVYPCGYLPVSAGNITRTSFETIWNDAEVFRALRDEDNLQGKCGYCEFRRVCMGCRARAYAYTGNYLAPEPYCVYEPARPGTRV
ncbi:MAG: heme b synthase [Armatimonadetes bacterium RBG_16_58_9]|nr:MAG: heme b synthase [Armatimonadetes bacterium RBG_16_58_9]